MVTGSPVVHSSLKRRGLFLSFTSLWHRLKPNPMSRAKMVIVIPMLQRWKKGAIYFYKLQALAGQHKCGRVIYQSAAIVSYTEVYHKNRRGSQRTGKMRTGLLFFSESKAQTVPTRGKQIPTQYPCSITVPLIRGEPRKYGITRWCSSIIFCTDKSTSTRHHILMDIGPSEANIPDTLCFAKNIVGDRPQGVLERSLQVYATVIATPTIYGLTTN